MGLFHSKITKKLRDHRDFRDPKDFKTFNVGDIVLYVDIGVKRHQGYIKECLSEDKYLFSNHDDEFVKIVSPNNLILLFLKTSEISETQ